MNLEKFGNFEGKENRERVYDYDAVVVLGGGLKKIGDKYYPTDYRDSDEFGMLGAGMRMVAALELYLAGRSKNFVFSTGVTEKNKSKFGENIPTEAEVYKDKFTRVIGGLRKRRDYKSRFEGLEEPDVHLEEISSNTLTNIEELMKMIKDKNWNRISIISSDYHIARVKALFEKISEEDEFKPIVDFISAEEFVKESKPGVYDNVIDEFYGGEEAIKRIENENRGLEDIGKGEYPK